MKKMRVVMVLAVIFAFLPTPVYAYIDPGTGSMVIQAIIAVVAGSIVFIRVYWNKFKFKFFAKKAPKGTKSNDNTDKLD